MGRKYTIEDATQLYFVSFATVNWVDVFTRSDYSDIVLDSLNYCVQQKALEVFAWCIMSNHVHLIISSQNNDLSVILRDLKRHSRKKILKAITEHPQESRREWMLWMFPCAGKRNPNNKNYQFWQQNNHPIELSTNEMIEQRVDYIHNNPVKAHIVSASEDYIYSSARDYCGEKGLVQLTKIED